MTGHVHEWETQNVCETCGHREAAPAPLDGETEDCPTCMRPMLVPQRGDHDYGLRLAAPLDGLREAGLRIARLKVPAHWGTGDGALAYEEALETAVAVAHAVLSQRLEALSHVHEWEDGWDDETEWYCPGCGMTGDPAAPAPLDGLREALKEVMAVNHSPFLGSDGIRPCLCVVHEDARVALRDEGETT